MEIVSEETYQFHEASPLAISEVPKGKPEVKMLELNVGGGI